MFSKVVVFEDSKEHQKLFESILAAKGCDTLTIDRAKPAEDSARILGFEPDLCIVDSEFESEIDGLDIIRFLQHNMPEVPIAVCSHLLDNPAKRNWILSRYRGLPGVRGVFGKKPFPTAEDIFSACVS